MTTHAPWRLPPPDGRPRPIAVCREEGVSVIVPAHNAAATLGACLGGLAAEGVPGPGVELIVVDDGSTDATAALASRPGARVLHGGGRGPAAARNLGARSARGEILVFLDADTAPRAGWLEHLLAPLADPSVVAVKGRYFSCQRGLVARFAQIEFEAKYDRLARARAVDFVDSGTAAFRRDAFLAIGGFDEGFPANSAEDVDLAFRLAGQGARFAFSPGAGVFHRHAEDLGAYLRKKARYGYYRARIYRQFPRKALGDAYTPPIMGLQIALAGLTGLLGLCAASGASGAGVGLAVALLAFGGTTAPLVRRAGWRQPALAVAAPPLSFARAFAQGAGIAVGIAALLARGLRGREARPPTPSTAGEPQGHARVGTLSS